ncbi:MAG: hypothetical protein AB9917_11225 [Negativicutes bacterium]
MKRLAQINGMRNTMSKHYIKGITNADRLSRTCLEMHNIAQEKNRLVKELSRLEQRRNTIISRLETLQSELQQMSFAIQQEETADTIENLPEFETKISVVNGRARKSSRGNILKY